MSTYNFTQRRVPRSDPNHPSRRMRQRYQVLLQMKRSQVMKNILEKTPHLKMMTVTGLEVPMSARMTQTRVLGKNPQDLGSG